MYKVLKIYDVALKFRHVSRDGQNTSKHVFSIQNTYFENNFKIHYYNIYISLTEKPLKNTKTQILLLLQVN